MVLGIPEYFGVKSCLTLTFDSNIKAKSFSTLIAGINFFFVFKKILRLMVFLAAFFDTPFAYGKSN